MQTHKNNALAIPSNKKSLLSAMLLVFSISVSANEFAQEKARPVAETNDVSIPTYYFSIDFFSMLELFKKDREHGRKIGSVTKPSYLDSYLTKVENLPGVGSVVLKGNQFAANPLMCLTYIEISLPKRGSPANTSGQTVLPPQRLCGTQSNWQTWQRSPNAGLVGFYNSYSLKLAFDPYSSTQTGSGATASINGYKGQVFNDYATPTGFNSELWGVTFFDQAGTGGRAQEIVMVKATWL